ncbi:MAG TPA: antibiotic biosynthesis monooxygenase [Candidatus Limnocylindrales bacterium]
MFARTSTLHGSPEQADRARGVFEHDVLPACRALPGFVGAQLLVDRRAAKVVATTFWESEAALRQSEDRVAELRRELAEAEGATATTVDRFEVGFMDTMPAIGRR